MKTFYMLPFQTTDSDSKKRMKAGEENQASNFVKKEALKLHLFTKH